MSKKTPFFKFDALSWLSGSIQYCTLAQKGLFTDLCAHYWNKKKPIQIDAKFKVRYSQEVGALSDLIGTLSDLELIVVSEAGITVPFLDALIDDRKEWLEGCAKGGRNKANSQGTPSNKKEERRKKSIESRKKKEEEDEEDEEKGIRHHPPFDPFSTIEHLPESYIKTFTDHCKQYFLTYKFTEEQSKEFIEYWLNCNEHGYPAYKTSQGWNPSRAIANRKRQLNELENGVKETKMEKYLRELREQDDESEEDDNDE